MGIFAITTLFSLITLPVEYDASRRAKDQLFRLGMVRAEEGEGVRQVLNAAALTYVAALVSFNPAAVTVLCPCCPAAHAGN